MGKYRNPIFPGFHPDPSICRVGSDYYLVTSSFEFFPGVPLFHSTDLVHWRQIGHVLTRESQLPLAGAHPSGGIYAPTIRHHHGRFYMVTTNVSGCGIRRGHFYVWTDDITGPWSDPVWVEGKGIDPDLFFDEDGRVIFTCTNGKAEIDLATGKVLAPLEYWRGTGGHAPEAPHLYRIDGYYYTMLAEGGTEFGHMITMARSLRPEGPFEPCPHNPIFSHRSMPSPIQSTGHGDLIQAPDGRWWLVFLGTRPVRYPWTHHLGRETFLAPVTWRDGWPVVNGGQLVTLEMEAEGVPDAVEVPVFFEDRFDACALRPEWNFLRNPREEDYRRGPDGIRLRCSPVSLDALDSPSWIGRRLAHFDAKASALLAFDPAEGEEAGLTLYMRAGFHYDVALTRRDGRRTLVARNRVGSLTTEKFAPVPETGEVELSIQCEREWFDLGYMNGGSRVSLLRTEARFLSTEMAGGFTGLFVALYAQGALENAWAHFRRFTYSA